ncbi:MAG: NADH-quinone oxidoreductase chain dehydrogenase chain chain [Pseudomonadota bacterium]|jgi:NADH-quinone oxidoreductase subunit A
MSELNPYLGILLLTVAAGGFLLTMVVLASVLGPKKVTKTKQMPWECGAIPVGSVREQRFSIRFYLVAMLFILFDIEVIFMYPWAVVLEQMGMFALLQMLSFMAVLVVGLIYVWKKGVLNWNE